MSVGGASGGTGGTLVSSGYERREILVVRGLQFNQGDVPEEWEIPEGLNDRLPGGLHAEADGSWTYRNDTQEVEYRIRQFSGKNDLRTALMTPGAQVIYAGHSRYGRGTCFGHDLNPGDIWEDGASGNLDATGIFRLGYPYIPVEQHDMETHQYHASPLKAEDPLPPLAQRHPAPGAGSYQRLTLREDLRGYVKTAYASPSHRYWAIMHGGQPHWLMVAGYSATQSFPYDLSGAPMLCRVFCHFGCSSMLHFHPVVRRLMGWRKSGNERFAYWTSNEAYPTLTAVCWLYRLFTYNRLSRGLNWEPSLEYARIQGNADLRQELRAIGERRTWRII